VWLLASVPDARGQTPARWKPHDMRRPRPTVITPGEAPGPVAPPSDAAVLFDGSDLSEWRSADAQPPKWIVRDGYMESVPGSGYLFTARTFGDVQLHIEWAAPTPVMGHSQGRGNSGVFLMGLYEVQVLDSYQNDTYPDGQAASLYGQSPPLVNASRPPGQWQAYDIVFRRPRFNADGELLQPARLTVFHNGVLVQDAVEAWGPTSWLQHQPYEPHPDKLPLSLQDHGNPVRYRNIWIRELRETLPPGPPEPAGLPSVTMATQTLDRYVGSYGHENNVRYRIARDQRRVYLIMGDRQLELIPRTKEEFNMRWTAGKVTFSFDSDGNPIGLTFQLGGEETGAQKLD
jgi:hypothetical protein